jgi:hypothetical protein
MKTYYIKAYAKFEFATAPTIVADLIAGANINDAIRQFYDDYEITNVPDGGCYAQIISVTEVEIVGEKNG